MRLLFQESEYTYATFIGSSHGHGLSHSEAESLLTLLHACAWVPPRDGDVASIYKLAVNDLKESEVWKRHIGVRQWLSTIWLNIPEVCLIVHVS